MNITIKKKFILELTSFAVNTVAAVCAVIVLYYMPRTGTFSVDNCAVYIENSEDQCEDLVFGPVGDAKTAAKIAAKYNKDIRGKSESPITVYYERRKRPLND